MTATERYMEQILFAGSYTTMANTLEYLIALFEKEGLTREQILDFLKELAPQIRKAAEEARGRAEETT